MNTTHSTSVVNLSYEFSGKSRLVTTGPPTHIKGTFLYILLLPPIIEEHSTKPTTHEFKKTLYSETPLIRLPMVLVESGLYSEIKIVFWN